MACAHCRGCLLYQSALRVKAKYLLAPSLLKKPLRSQYTLSTLR